ncbi:hypothetical protein E8E13_000993 [Curvularia kusanoi]|uniref:Uncharacterized protein n=1 Tax=Curvularia kusanoi TaxID=90978 RepID=A0A9P4T803_CURKU|nr:hypothetical protein E8E13_000993 [Curvularia kusanoi]
MEGESAHSQNNTKSAADELLALCQANAILTQRLREFETEDPQTREARKLRLKHAEIEQLKASVEQTHAETDAIKLELAERQTYLRELNERINDLVRPVPFAVKETRKKDKPKGKKGEVRGGSP